MNADMNKSNIVRAIGVPAMIEQLAEEALELGHPCVKLARLLRGENKVYGYSEEQLLRSIEEEIADIFVVFMELNAVGVIDGGNVTCITLSKLDRWKKRLEEEKGGGESVKTDT